MPVTGQAEPLGAEAFSMLLAAEQTVYQAWSEAIIWMASIALAFAVGFYLIGKIRGAFRQSDREAGILLDNFRDLHSRGELSDEEYRTIKSKLASQLREQWKADDVRRSEGAEQGRRGV